MEAYFWLNHPDTPEEKWVHLRQQFFTYLLQHTEEWRAIKESNPLDFMVYMTHCLKHIIGLRLTGLETYTSWIKSGSYYHWVVAHDATPAHGATSRHSPGAGVL